MPPLEPRSLGEHSINLLSVRLQQGGWIQVGDRPDVLVLQESPEVEFQLGLNARMDNNPPSVAFEPALGVMHPMTSRLEGQFLGLAPSSGALAATVGAGLADILFLHGIPVGDRWTIRAPSAIDSVTSVLDGDIETYGMPFFQALPTLDTLAQYLEQRTRTQDQDGKLAIVNALNHRMPAALDALKDFAAKAARQRPPMSTQSWRFVRSFIAHFEIDEATLTFDLGPT